MLTINSIKNGIVIDHIKSGGGIKIFNYLGLDKVDYRVALIMNVESEKLGRKDIIKIENVLDIDFTLLGLMDKGITIDIIKEEKIAKKISLSLPEEVEDVIKCKNPRCITSIEPYLKHVHYLVNEKTKEYRCKYCDDIRKVGELI
ncbi:MAG: aspartate carbamoyltransferase regulatory subunit [Clostridium argentinense]|uniref:Aspartate carbamoyltransferase regulatory subunit n=1 Tax=Clostridium faecium TaxID=2762223 RepID=A0ABR8YWH0_9CLOT|nr:MULTISPECIES: aspartate carbamoyltransferase regulatory subunit [Clostridium]MBD8048585.1 aspartate carbamoyltransferase regulatory subunit [Clostridium faecium]MBS5823424.1 aspartate carbamoyltransferase regulatory subunit [Clostridium argentinense]MDU1348591.1 aspartate carbamoyltransferase regulatory subunit [Clostridium argentinense]